MNDISTSWHSYPKIYTVGHAYLKDFFHESVIAEEKIDGSQFSFGIFNGEIRVRSKSVEMYADAPEGMFKIAVDIVKRLSPILKNGWTYRAEYLVKPKHNALSYERIPVNHLIIFDINSGHESYLSYDEKNAEAGRLGLECVPKIFEGSLSTAESFRALLEKDSVLGGQKIEGVVFKNYSKFGPDKKVLMAKFVSESFKEVHKSEWKVSNPGKADILAMLSAKYQHPGRWTKAIHHMRERGELTQSPKDIGRLMKEIQSDIASECIDEIKSELYEWAKGDILRGAIRGVPEFYKEWLVKEQFK